MTLKAYNSALTVVKSEETNALAVRKITGLNMKT